MIAWVSQSSIDEIIAEADAQFPAETGGVLVGYWAPHKDTVVILRAVGPGPKAQHTRVRFSPDSHFHDNELARLYESSGRRHTYLGDWHTHPGGTLTLSCRDSKTLLRIARTPQARAETPLMLIAAGKPGKWDIAVFRGTATKLVPLWTAIRCERLEPVVFVS